MATQNAVDVGLAGSTGTGNFVGANTPTLITPVLGDATATSITFNPTTGGIVGTTTNDSPTAGDVGEYLSTTVLIGSQVAVTSNTNTNVATLVLTAGDWDVWGSVATNPASGTISTNYVNWISTVSATLPTYPNNGGIFFLEGYPSSGAATQCFPAGRMRISLSGTTTVYLSTYISFTVSTMGAYGFIGARRER